MSLKGEVPSEQYVRLDRSKPTIASGEGRTKQSFREQVNINSIMAKFNKTGMINHLNRTQPFYGDVSGIVSYQESLNIVKNAEDLFMGMSAEIRSKFANDPANMIAFLNDPANRDEAIKLGMVLAPPVEPVPQKVQIVDNDDRPAKGRKSSKSDED